MSNVIQLPSRSPVVLTKKELGRHLKRSERWIEMRVREGMPVLAANDRYGRRRYDLADVETWLKDGKPREATLEERMAALERQMSELMGRTG